jgi:Rrf2 family protein
MRAMLLLASGAPALRMSTTELSDGARIPRKYLEQILRDLKRAGLVRSYAGVHGGYELTRPATDITTGEIIRSLDSMSIMSCVGEVKSTDTACEQLLGCSLRPLWQRLDRAMHEVLESTTLHQLTQGSCRTQPARSTRRPVIPLSSGG